MSSTPSGPSTTQSGTSHSTRRCWSRSPADRASTWPSNVYYGASFASPYEVDQAVVHGNATQLLWGSDYPHLEGTFVNPEDSDAPSVTRLALRHTFCHTSAEDTRRMVGQNAIDVYNLDAEALRAVAIEIEAPTLADLATPIDAVPAGASLTAFRSGAGGWG